MTKVITYGTYDLLHYGHIRLLERAKALGDYLIVGVTAEDYDKTRGKLNVRQSLMERIEAVRATGLADEIIVEEYEGQKIDDIRRYHVDIFTVGSDWVGKFDYLNEYCRVVYLDRTEGISSTDLRAKEQTVRLGLMGNNTIAEKYLTESAFVNGLTVSGMCVQRPALIERAENAGVPVFPDYSSLLDASDAVYIVSHPRKRAALVREALEKGKHVLCESPIALSEEEARALFREAEEKHLVLFDAIKTAYSTAYTRLLVLLKSGVIGPVVSVEATCTSLRETEIYDPEKIINKQNSICAWGPTALLPVLQLLGTEYRCLRAESAYSPHCESFDLFTRLSLVYDHAVATVRVGKGVKSEGELIVSGTKGYVYVPAPWWKTDYFEVRYEDPSRNRRYFYQLDGEGIRYELVAFLKAMADPGPSFNVDKRVSEVIARVAGDVTSEKNVDKIVFHS